PPSDDARLAVIARRTAGFIYYVSVAGVTGVKAVDTANVGPAVARVRKATGLPVAVGFRIRTPEQGAAGARGGVRLNKHGGSQGFFIETRRAAGRHPRLDQAGARAWRLALQDRAGRAPAGRQ